MLKKNKKIENFLCIECFFILIFEIKMYIYIKVEQKYLLLSRWFNEKTCRCSAFDSNLGISERERNICHTLTFFINEYYVLRKKFPSTSRKDVLGGGS